MKVLRKALWLLLLGQGLALGSRSVQAGPAQPPPEPPPGGPGMQRPFQGGPNRFGGGGRLFGRAWRNGAGGPMQNPAVAAARQSLTPEDRQRLASAYAAAMADPQVRAAFANRQADPRAFRLTMRDAMIKADPSLSGTFQKMQQATQQARGEANQKFQNRVGFLSEDERATLVKSRQAVQNDPAVVAARQQRDAATTPEARAQSQRAYNQAVQGAMIRNDAKVGPILEKIRQQRVTEAPKSAPNTTTLPPPR